MSGDDAALAAICAHVAERTGTALSRQQRERLERAVRARLGERTPPAFLARLSAREGALELAELMSVVSVHKTDLFRDEVQLESLQRHVLGPLAAQARALHLWSAGCATGEEVATLLVLLAEVGAHQASSVLGTDISGQALGAARPLRFGPSAMRRVPPVLAERYFQHRGDGWHLAPSLAAQARFAQHNLMDLPYPLPEARGGFDVIVCRNVLIYFTASAAERVVTRLAERLVPGGVLVLSAAEPILHPRKDLETRRYGNVFFYSRLDEAAKPLPPRPGAPPPPRPSSPPPRPSAPPPPTARSTSGELSAAAGLTPQEEGLTLFELVLDWAASGEQSDQETEAGLRKALYLAPDLAAGRYMLGLLLEQRGSKADSASEYRRAIATLESGRALSTPFYLNAARLEAACHIALERLGYRR